MMPEPELLLLTKGWIVALHSVIRKGLITENDPQTDLEYGHHTSRLISTSSRIHDILCTQRQCPILPKTFYNFAIESGLFPLIFLTRSLILLTTSSSVYVDKLLTSTS